VPSIITQKEFTAAQDKLAKNRALSDRNAKYRYLLKGLVACGCGKKLYGYPCHGKPRYKCSDKYLSHPLPKTCNRPSIAVPVVDEAVWAAFMQVLSMPEVVAAKVNEMHLDRATAEAEVEKKATKVKKELEASTGQEERLLKAYAASVITLSQLKAQLAELKTNRESLVQEAQRIERQSAGFKPLLAEEAVQNYFHELQGKAEQASFDLRRQIMRLFIHQVVVDGRKALVKAYLPGDLSTESTGERCRGHNEDRDQFQAIHLNERKPVHGFAILLNLDHPEDVSVQGGA
jgi:D-ribose pyranose/furanose isomerase RbsD